MNLLHIVRLTNTLFHGKARIPRCSLAFFLFNKIKGILLDNLVINGIRISDTMPGNPSWIKMGDMARIFIGEHVEDITFK